VYHKLLLPTLFPVRVMWQVCENGSLFDLYCTKGKRFDVHTALRLGKECASGLAEIHRLGYMHRDIKSL
jgi:serine/threonine protein kinase